MGSLDELFDIVDRFDRVVGTAPRRQVHAEGLLHRAIHVLIFNRQGQVFLQKRSMKKDLAKGLWDSSCSGHVDSGEEYDIAAQRELGEELTLLLSEPPPRWYRADACAETGNEFVWVYRMVDEGPFVLNPEEIDDGRWCDPHWLDASLASEPTLYSPAFSYLWRRRPAT